MLLAVRIVDRPGLLQGQPGRRPRRPTAIAAGHRPGAAGGRAACCARSPTGARARSRPRCGPGTRRCTARVSGPDGRPGRRRPSPCDERTAVVELATAAGLGLRAARSADRHHARGRGADRGRARRTAPGGSCSGIGGSATTDGGAGMLQALGVRLLDADGRRRPARRRRAGAAGPDRRRRPGPAAGRGRARRRLRRRQPADRPGRRGARLRAAEGRLARGGRRARRGARPLRRRPGAGPRGRRGRRARRRRRGRHGGRRAGRLGARIVVRGRAGLRPGRAATRRWRAPTWSITGRGGAGRADPARQGAGGGGPAGARRPVCRAWRWPASSGCRTTRSPPPGLAAAHALTEVEPDVGRCLAEPELVLADLAARVVPGWADQEGSRELRT